METTPDSQITNDSTSRNDASKIDSPPPPAPPSVWINPFLGFNIITWAPEPKDTMEYLIESFEKDPIEVSDMMK